MKTVFFAVFSLLLVLQGTSVSQAAGCTLEGVQLICPGENDADIMASFAAPETLALLSDPVSVRAQFQKPFDLERFRRSLEKTWARVNRAERSERRRMLRRRISAEEFETWSQTYRNAEANYDAGLVFYRNLVWLGKTGKQAPAG